MEHKEYSGSQQLEAMREAVRYNAHLTGLVVRHAAGAARAVDFGAGIGTFSGFVREAGLDVVCVELDAAQRGQLERQGFVAHAALDAFPDASVDYVYSLNVLEHIDDHEAVIGHMRRVLRPGGRLLVYVPAFPCLYTAMDRQVGHVRRYTRQTLVPLLAGAGFAVETSRYVDSLGFFATLAYKWLGSDTGEINTRALRLYDRVAFPCSLLLDTLASPFFGKNLLVVARR
ncbi:MAG: class I SAM-dependent methyltransferase [Desulfovibrionaceae bacterium]